MVIPVVMAAAIAVAAIVYMLVAALGPEPQRIDKPAETTPSHERTAPATTPSAPALPSERPTDRVESG